MPVGGKREGAGRPPGARNKATALIREAAQRHGEVAIKVLVDIAKDTGAPPAARVAAANGLLDRGYGKPTQPIEHDGEIGLRKTLGHFYGEDGDEAYA